MSNDRRFVLKGLAAAGLLAAMPWAQANTSAATPLAGAAAADAAARVTPLVSGGALDAAKMIRQPAGAIALKDERIQFFFGFGQALVGAGRQL